MDQQSVPAEDAAGVEGEPFDCSRGLHRNRCVCLQERQYADVAQQATVIVREMRCVIVLQRGKLRQRYGAQQKNNQHSSSVGAAAECHLHLAYHSRNSDSRLSAAFKRVGIDQ